VADYINGMYRPYTQDVCDRFSELVRSGTLVE
jgi:hypothetical protein